MLKKAIFQYGSTQRHYFACREDLGHPNHSAETDYGTALYHSQNMAQPNVLRLSAGDIVVYEHNLNKIVHHSNVD